MLLGSSSTLTPIFTPTHPNILRLRPTRPDEELPEIPVCQGILRHHPAPGHPLASLEQNPAYGTARTLLFGIVSQNPLARCSILPERGKTLTVTISYEQEGEGLSSVAAAWRKLPWWVEPVTIVAVLSAFGLYSLAIVILLPGQYEEYLSPFYSPPVGRPEWLPGFITAPMFVLWIPLGFRATCYYYRKAYFRAFFWDPPACSAGEQQREPRSAENYRGERAVFVLNNVHRYFLYASIMIVAFLLYDAVLTFFPDGSFGVKVGSIIWVVNVVLLTLYTVSCHSVRHLIGGNRNCYTCVRGSGARLKAYNGVSRLNMSHPLWAWLSLGSLLLADVYLRLIAAGVIPDLTIIG